MGRPPKAKTNPEVKEIEATENTNVQLEEATVVVDAEKEELRRQVAEQQKQMQELMAQMKLMAEMVSNKGNSAEKPINEKRNSRQNEECSINCKHSSTGRNQISPIYRFTESYCKCRADKIYCSHSDKRCNKQINQPQTEHKVKIYDRFILSVLYQICKINVV